MSESQEPEWITLAADIRAVDGNHDLGAASLAAALIARGWSRAIDRAALVAAVARLFDSREVELADDPATNRATVLDLLNTLPAAPTIDSAWRRATEALPEGWYGLSLLNQRHHFTAYVLPPRDGMGTWSFDADSPAAALDSLADALLHRGETGT